TTARPPLHIATTVSSVQADDELDDAISASYEPQLDAIEKPTIEEKPVPVAPVEVAQDEATDLDDDLALPDATQLWPTRPKRVEVAESDSSEIHTSHMAGRVEDFGEEIEIDQPMEPAATIIEAVSPA